MLLARSLRLTGASLTTRSPATGRPVSGCSPKPNYATFIDAFRDRFSGLGYFILPTDLIPDVVPITGFTDDLAALIAAYRFVRYNITPEVEARAKAKLAERFGDVDENEIIIG